MRSVDSLSNIEMMEQQQVPFIDPWTRSPESNSLMETPSVEDRTLFSPPPQVEVEDVGEPSMGEAVDGPPDKEDKRRRRRLTKEKWDKK